MSSRTPKKLADATESALSPSVERLIAAVVVSGLCLLFAAGVLVAHRPKILQTPSGSIQLEIVDTPEARREGLAGRSSLPADSGMLFVFDDETASNCFWMKDTLISLDFVWLDSEKQVVSVTSNVSPDSYPQSFCPDEPASFGLEINAGQAEAFGLQAGVRVTF